ncbi:DNA-binding response regulator [Desertihabitans brevis]|uniref:DNA-binding response regulator n=1 Tax=Desertihabitans brevis TaxID=2268447 RepID=A0A367YZF0_9ACTN|nr:response regulator transcription factor [Desertihabitans brevis]RCK71224.1 DNA-binding response regulator [Desertihabitans brevis]
MRVLLCDDHPVFRDGLRLLLEELGVETVAEAGTGEEALEAVARTAPDVVVMDLHLPGMGGLEAIRVLSRRHPQVRVLALTMLEEDATVLAALRAGASGYLLKGAGHAEIRLALDAVVGGSLVVGAPVVDRVRASLGAGAAPVLPQLTGREREVLELMSRGRSNEHIAEVLVLSVKTVRNLVSNILAKLGAASRAQAVAIARDAGLGRPPG